MMRAALGAWLLAAALVAGCSDSYVIAHGRVPDAGSDARDEPGSPCLGSCASPLPRLPHVEVAMRGDTAIIELAGVAGAIDYRVYPLPEPSAVGRDGQGRTTVRDAIYRCSGRRTAATREEEYGSLFSESLTAADNGTTVTPFRR